MNHISFDEFMQSQQEYSLFWKDKFQSFQEAYSPALFTLEYHMENFRNSLIKGDNLEVLKNLYQQNQEVDFIYIDIPYNTGNQFIYSDNFSSRSKGKLSSHSTFNHLSFSRSRHVLWLDFMYPRLLLAHEILSDSGVICISINDVELANLTLLCNEIFGEKNFITNIIWQNKYTLANDNKKVSSQTEYILVYAKNHENFRLNKEPLNEQYVKDTYKNPDNDPRGLWRSIPLHKPSNPHTYKVVSPNGKEWIKRWNYNEEGFARLLSEDKIYWGKDGNACPSKKLFLSETTGRGIGNLWLGETVGYSSTGGEDLFKLLGTKNVFQYPKPVVLIKRLLKIFTQPNSLVLDFFAGSGTTGQAAIELLSEQHPLSYILVQSDEPIPSKYSSFIPNEWDIYSIFDITRLRIDRTYEKEKISPSYNLGFLLSVK